MKTIETLFGEVHEGIVVINEDAINESVNNDDDKAEDTSVLFYNDTASQLLKTRPKTNTD